MKQSNICPALNDTVNTAETCEQLSLLQSVACLLQTSAATAQSLQQANNIQTVSTSWLPTSDYWQCSNMNKISQNAILFCTLSVQTMYFNSFLVLKFHNTSCYETLTASTSTASDDSDMYYINFAAAYINVCGMSRKKTKASYKFSNKPTLKLN